MTVIIILALVALFVGLRLYAVLGRRTGHEQQPILRPAESPAAAEPAAPVADAVPERPTSNAGSAATIALRPGAAGSS